MDDLPIQPLPPEWVASDAVPVKGLDLLGLRVPVERIGLTLLVAVTTISPTIRYISLRAWIAQRAGGRVRYGWQGYAPRRRWFRGHWYTDDLGKARRSPWGEARARRLIQHTAEHYLNERYRRKLFNQGVPAASRHDPGSRGSTRSWS